VFLFFSVILRPQWRTQGDIEGIYRRCVLLLWEIIEQGKWELAALSLTLGLTLVLSAELLDGDDGQTG